MVKPLVSSKHCYLHIFPIYLGAGGDYDPIFSTLRHAATMRKPTDSECGDYDRFDTISEESVPSNQVVTTRPKYEGSSSHPGYSSYDDPYISDRNKQMEASGGNLRQRRGGANISK